MRVRDVMSSDVETCRPETDGATVAKLMWDRDCGFIPVTDRSGALRGVVTDRDICIASATRGLLPGYMSASQLMTYPVHACRPDDDVTDALAAMKRFKVGRLPVIGETGTLTGVLSLNDIVLAAERSDGPDAKEIVSTLAAICQPRPAAPDVVTLP
jgi:CBS domain-containing protein